MALGHEDVSVAVIRAVGNGLISHQIEQSLATYAGIHPGVIGDVRCDGQRTSGRALIQQDRFVIATGAIQSTSASGRAAAHNDLYRTSNLASARVWRDITENNAGLH